MKSRPVLYGLFAASGFAGLIYESIWTHYLKLFLGHAAYAQTLVLVIFMGGMAAGAWLAARSSRRWSNPLLLYVVVELSLGVLGALFDPVFRGVQGWCFDHAIPALQSGLSIDLLKWTVSALLILPQCVLLGMTFPLMSAAVVRGAPTSAGAALGWLYFTNSLGAAIGVLVSGFALIKAVGLPGTLLVAAALNFTVGAGAWIVSKIAGTPAPPPATTADRTTDLPTLLFAAAFLTGAASFFYEIGWIRMLSLVLSSATHAFELMLSAFILGLALGSFWIRNRIGSFEDPRRALAWIQVAMGTLALGSLVVYGFSFDWMAAILRALQRNDAGYVLYTLFSHGICVALMLPVTFCAGMTLPLITAMLIRASYGEAAIGRVYAANTLGSIAGVIVAVHAVMPLLGLRAVIIAGALVDLGLGLWLLRGRFGGRVQRGGAGALVATAVVMMIFARFDPAKLASGVYRSGTAKQPRTLLFHRDGKTASVDVYSAADGTLSIATNGKVDAGLNLRTVGMDDYTMILSGAVPLAMNPAASDVAVIGIGSGRSTHTVLGSSRVQQVDTIEIEPAMIEGARLFGPAVQRAYEDPRSRLHIEDAKTFFSRTHRQYDAIISEPSNPWMSGVATLFSGEFYAQAKRHLKPGGVLVQWMQLYEIDLPLVSTVLRALGDQFSDYEVLAANDFDMLIVAVPSGRVPEFKPEIFSDRGVADLLGWLGMHSVADLQMRVIGRKEQLQPWVASLGMPANSDYFPVLDQNAQRRFFRGDKATDIHQLQVVNLLMDGMPAGYVARSAYDANVKSAVQIQELRSYVEDSGADAKMDSELIERVNAMRAAGSRCGAKADDVSWFREYLKLLDVVPFFDADTTHAVVGYLTPQQCGAPREIQRWLALLEAVGNRQWGVASQIGNELLPASRPARLPRDSEEAITRTLLVADLKSGNVARARERLRNISRGTAESVGIAYLRAIIEQGT